tara:strand:- start:99 stop:266 length:168 start_codon:yes stop_codon:yes gene_type:complete
VIRLAKAVLTAYVATDFSHTGEIGIGKSGVCTPVGRGPIVGQWRLCFVHLMRKKS